MTHEEQAAIIIDSLDRDYTKLDGTWTNRDEAVKFIAAALQAARQAVWEEVLTELGTPARWAVPTSFIDWCREQAAPGEEGR